MIYNIVLLKGTRKMIQLYMYIYICISAVQFSDSVMSNSLRPQNCGRPGLPVQHQLPEST